MAFADLTFTHRVLWSGAVLAGASFFHHHWNVPLHVRATESLQAIEDVRGRLDGARYAIQEIKEKEQQTARGRKTLHSLHGDRPSGPAATWLPVEIRNQLSHSGITEVMVRQNAAEPEAGLSGYERTYWRLTLPKQPVMQGITGMLLAAAEVELHFPFVRVLDLSFQCDAEAPGFPAGGLNISALTQK